MESLSPLIKLSIFIALACLGLAIYFVLDASDILRVLRDGKVIQEYISATGNFGPVVIILLMTTAILISPLPSAPIAVAAGTIYGHIWGTVYVIAGSLSGASGAFSLPAI